MAGLTSPVNAPLLEIHVLGPESHLATAHDCGDLAEVRKRRTDRDGDAIFIANSLHDSRSQLLSRGTGGVHLPIASDKWFSHVDDPLLVISHWSLVISH